MNPCPICKHSSLSTTTIGATPLMHCNSCDIFFLKNIPNQETLETYYTSSYLMSNNDILASEHRRLFRHTEQHSLIQTMQSMGLHAGNSILDIGCDKGYFIDEARRFGFEVQGVEPSETARAYCKRIKLDVVPALQDIHKEFDAITLWHVLEHFPNPVQALQEISQHLNPGGFIFVRVPDFSSFWSKVLRKAWIWFQPQNHYFHYSPVSLRTLFSNNGFTVHSCISRKPNNRFTTKSGQIADAFYNAEFEYRLSLKKRLARIYENLTGVEVFLIAQKQ